MTSMDRHVLWLLGHILGILRPLLHFKAFVLLILPCLSLVWQHSLSCWGINVFRLLQCPGVCSWSVSRFQQNVCVKWHPCEYQESEFPSRILLYSEMIFPLSTGGLNIELIIRYIIWLMVIKPTTPIRVCDHRASECWSFKNLVKWWTNNKNAKHIYVLIFICILYVYNMYCLPCVTALTCMAQYNSTHFWLILYHTLMTYIEWNQLIWWSVLWDLH